MKEAYTLADIAARKLADDENKRTTSDLQRQRKKILPATSDSKCEITEMKCVLREHELHLAALHSRKHYTATVLPTANHHHHHQAFFKQLQPAAVQSPATPEVNPSFKAAAIQSLAPAPHAVKLAPYPADMQPPAPRLP